MTSPWSSSPPRGCRTTVPRCSPLSVRGVTPPERRPKAVWGPTLQGVFGRQIAGGENYDYSESFESLDGAWTEQNLDSFLADPQEFAPGLAMRWDGISDLDRRRSVITYLKDL